MINRNDLNARLFYAAVTAHKIEIAGVEWQSKTLPDKSKLLIGKGTTR